MANFMIYGATGYTGRLASEYSKSIGLNAVVAGRSTGSIKQLADSLGFSYRTFDANDRQAVDENLRGIRVLLNCAGPFARTAEPLMDACIRSGVHYLDVSAELISYQLAEQKNDEAKAANVMLLPGCGGSVAMLGCLAGHAIKSINKVTSIDIALFVAGAMSRGSAISAAEGVTAETLQRQNGQLIEHKVQDTAEFDFDDGKGSVSCFPVTLPDLLTIWKSTDSPNIKTFVHVSGNAFPTGDLAALPDGPTADERKANPYHAAVVAKGEDGAIKKAVLHTANGYEFTSVACIEAAKRVLDGKAKGGFQTPVIAFGSDFVTTILGSTLKDIYLVTGASRGLGYGMVKVLAANPQNKVIGLVRDATATKARLSADNISNVYIVAADITDDKALKTAAEETERFLGDEGLDVLINNAAYVSKSTELKDFKEL
ncbi:Saccharopine dehydrogenase domain-containing protein [Trichoderma velutinum]